MLKDVKLPDIGEGVTEGEMIKWLVKAGDAVKADQPIAEVMTDKATVEVPSPIAGVVKELKVKEGDIVPIESVMLVLETGAGAAATSSAEPSPRPAPATVSATGPVKPTPVSEPPKGNRPSGGLEVYPPAVDSRVLATPSTRRLAREMLVDINGLQGSGLAGRVTREDVLQVRGSRPSETAPPSVPVRFAPGLAGSSEERVPLRGIRRKIAENMQITKRVVPHFTLMDEANVTELVKFREQLKATGEKYGVKITYLPFVMKALIAACREFPMVNASIDDEKSEIIYKKYFNIGFAADTPNGLVVPVIKNADQKTILQISQEIGELAARAREGKLKAEEMKDATVTITNIGSVGGQYATPIINHPEVAILGMYKIWDKPVWSEGQFVPAKVMNFTITCDHRLIDGAVAARFLNAFLSRVTNPGQLMMDMV
jgi:pyruvate dehydrogenase E2 component (dihydrolipoamide acetyltransferase)